MKQLLFCGLLFISAAATSQRVIDIDKNDANPTDSKLLMIVGGNPLGNTKYVRIVSGTPYFSETWMKGKVLISGGKMYGGVRFRLDLLDNSLQYINGDGREMIATSPVTNIVLTDSISGKEYLFAHQSTLPPSKDLQKGWYQVLSDGKGATLYMHNAKSIQETRPYGTATYEQHIRDFNQYYIQTDSAFTLVKKFNSIPDVLSDKKDELTAYIKSQKLSGKSTEDYTALIDYYNSLFK